MRKRDRCSRTCGCSILNFYLLTAETFTLFSFSHSPICSSIGHKKIPIVVLEVCWTDGLYSDDPTHVCTVTNTTLIPVELFLMSLTPSQSRCSRVLRLGGGNTKEKREKRNPLLKYFKVAIVKYHVQKEQQCKDALFMFKSVSTALLESGRAASDHGTFAPPVDRKQLQRVPGDMR